MTIEQWITVLGIVMSFLVWFLGQKWGARKSAKKMWTDLMVVAIPVGLLLLSIIVFENDRTNSLKADTKSLHDEITILENSLRSSGYVEVLNGYDDFAASIEREVRLTHSRWLVTRVQNIQAPTSKEQRYFETMVLRVMKGDIADCRRIVRIPAKEHLDLYRKLLTTMRHSPYFAMSIWKANEPPFDYELLIGDDVVIFAFGSGAPTWALRIPNKAAADRFAATFDDLWRRSSSNEIIKDKKDVTDDAEFDSMIKRIESFAQ
jgi:hypothetical protein